MGRTRPSLPPNYACSVAIIFCSSHYKRRIIKTREFDCQFLYDKLHIISNHFIIKCNAQNSMKKMKETMNGELLSNMRQHLLQHILVEKECLRRH